MCRDGRGRKNFIDTFWRPQFSIWRLKKKFQLPVGACLKKLILDPDCQHSYYFLTSETCPIWDLIWTVFYKDFEEKRRNYPIWEKIGQFVAANEIKLLTFGRLSKVTRNLLKTSKDHPIIRENFRRFPKITRTLPKISGYPRTSPKIFEDRPNASEDFRRSTEDFRRSPNHFPGFPKTSDNLRRSPKITGYFRSFPNFGRSRTQSVFL